MTQMEFEQVVPDRDSSFKVAVFEAAHFTAPLHFHPEYELVLIEEGDGICTTVNFRRGILLSLEMDYHTFI